MKIAYADFWPDFCPDTLPLTQIIRSIIDIQEVKEIKTADFLVYSCMGESHWMIPDKAVKIFYTGENLCPDFNACDYAIGFDWLDFGDRYLRFPLYYFYKDICNQMEGKHLVPIEKILKGRDAFCSVTISNSNRNPIFKDLYYELSSYKKVDSGGKWENNVGGPVKDKYSFDCSHKFSIVCENSSTPGYTTEKLVQAFAANCIPIYWGDPEIGRVFNKKAFINVQDYGSIGEVLEKVKAIDSNNELYYEMLREPALIDDEYSKEKQLSRLKDFLTPIFTLPIDKVRRRNRLYWGEKYISSRRNLFQPYKSSNWIKFKEIIYDIIH